MQLLEVQSKIHMRSTAQWDIQSCILYIVGILRVATFCSLGSHGAVA